MAKLVVVAVVIVMMLVCIEGKESLSSDKKATGKTVARSMRSLSELVRSAVAKRQSSKRDTCVGFGETCGWIFGDSCCEGQGLVCEPDNDSYMSDGTCWYSM